MDRSLVLHDAVIRSGARLEGVIVDAGVEIAADADVRSADPGRSVTVVANNGAAAR